MGAYVVRTSSLNDKHSCQLVRIDASFSSVVLLSFSVSMANLSCLPASTFSSPRFLFNSLSSPHFNLLRVAKRCFSSFSIYSFSRLGVGLVQQPISRPFYMTHRLYMAIHCNFIAEYQLCNYTVSALVFLAMALLHTFGFSFSIT